MRLPSCTSCFLLITALPAAEPVAARSAPIPEGPGLAARYPGDRGIAKDPQVIMVENFEADALDQVKKRWTASGDKANALALDADVLPQQSLGKRSLRITAKKGENEGGYLYHILPSGHDEVHVRMYVRFADDYGFNHHFCKIAGDLDPKPWPVGRAGLYPDTSFTTGLEPTTAIPHTWPMKSLSPPGFWHFYTYYAGMHSWQTEDGKTNGQPNPYYGNNFTTLDPQPIERGQWTCLEWAVGLNTTAESSDGWQRFWVDGKLVGNWSPGTPEGYWMRENFRLRPDQPERAQPFEGFRWRKDMKLQINQIKIENYVSEGSFKHDAEYKAEHPDFVINTEQAVVWFDDVVIAKTYIGPMVTTGAKP